ncbi:hypothetical protein D9M68_722910 [compost metagenome]
MPGHCMFVQSAWPITSAPFQFASFGQPPRLREGIYDLQSVAGIHYVHVDHSIDHPLRARATGLEVGNNLLE